FAPARRGCAARPARSSPCRHSARGLRARCLFFESASHSELCLEHDLFRKPVSTFRDRARVPAASPPENGLYARASLYRTYAQPSLRRARIMRQLTRWLGAVLVGSALAQPAWAAPCRNDMTFERWLDDFKREAVSQGVSRQVADSALAGVTF